MRTHIISKHRPIARRGVCRLKARGYSILSLLWCSVTFQVLEILRESPVDPLSWGGLVCFILIAPHPVMVGLALYYAMRERPVNLRKWTEDPNADLREMGWFGAGKTVESAHPPSRRQALRVGGLRGLDIGLASDACFLARVGDLVIGRFRKRLSTVRGRVVAFGACQ